jgi:hypothetical protein
MMEDMEMMSTLNDDMNNILIHNILEKLLEEWVDEFRPEL